MSGLTLTAGLSFSGGFTFTEAPETNNTAAWFGGGQVISPYSPRSTVERITYATDTATASVRGPLSSDKTRLAAASNTTDGWFGGGYLTSTVDRITYATDTATASVRGPLSLARAYLAAAGNSDYGWFGGGSPGSLSRVDRITYATDTATASVRGPLSSARGGISAAGNTTDGWFGGSSTTVDRITYVNDTATASIRGSLSLNTYGVAAAGNTTDAWFGGAYVGGGGGGGFRSYVQRITFATDTDTASVRGPLSSARYVLAAAGNTTDGWFGGGETLPLYDIIYTTRIDRITYATDTVTASIRGPLSAGKKWMAAAGGIQ